MEGLIAALLMLLLGGTATAQSWTGNTRDDGRYLHGTVTYGQGAKTWWCNTPSPQSFYRLVSDANPEVPKMPCSIRPMLGSVLTMPPGRAQLQLVLWIDGPGSALPLGVFGEKQDIRAVDIGIDQPIIQKVLAAQTVTADMQGGFSWTIPCEGLGIGLRGAMAHCNFGWQNAGHSLPCELAGAISSDQRGMQSFVAPKIGFASPPQFTAHANQMCKDLATKGTNARQAADLDGDGQPDVVMDWTKGRCPELLARGFCGAGNCLVAVFVSSRGYLNPEQLLGIGPQIVIHGSGWLGASMSGSFSLHTENACSRSFVWNGVGLRRKL